MAGSPSIIDLLLIGNKLMSGRVHLTFTENFGIIDRRANPQSYPLLDARGARKEERMRYTLLKTLIVLLAMVLLVLMAAVGCGLLGEEVELEMKFWASEEVIPPGGCAMVHWKVQGAEGYPVFLNGEEVPPSGEEEVCLEESATFELAVRAPGGPYEERVTIEVEGGPGSPLPASPTPVLPESTEMPGSPTVPPIVPTSTATQIQVPAPTMAPLLDIEIVVDNRDPAFSTRGWWFTGDGGQSYNGDCHWAPRGIQNIAYVEPELPLSGAYEVFAWWCGDANHDQSIRTRIEIYPTTGRVATYPVYVNLQENAGQWNSLGTYYLEEDGFLSIGGNLDGNVVADAFRFVYRWPEYVVITPTPLPTPVVWTHHPPSPVEQLTAGDLTARLGLVQPFYEYTPVISMETANFDDCEAFPRDGCGGTREGWRVQVQYQDMVVTYHVSQDYHFAALESPDALANRQLLYLTGGQGNRYFRVDHYSDDTWHLSGADYDGTWASHLQLDAQAIETLRSFVQVYNSLIFETPDGLTLRLFGLGERVEVSSQDQAQLGTFGAELARVAWFEGE
jgi:hypothetical protein